MQRVLVVLGVLLVVGVAAAAGLFTPQSFTAPPLAPAEAVAWAEVEVSISDFTNVWEISRINPMSGAIDSYSPHFPDEVVVERGFDDTTGKWVFTGDVSIQAADSSKILSWAFDPSEFSVSFNGQGIKKITWSTPAAFFQEHGTYTVIVTADIHFVRDSDGSIFNRQRVSEYELLAV